MSRFLFFFVLAAATLAGCGTPGIPLPPSLELPKPVDDLHALRKGDKVYLSWTRPTLTTDRRAIHHLGRTHICRSLGAFPKVCTVVAEIPSPPTTRPAVLPAQKATPSPAVEHYADNLTTSAFADPFGNITYAVDVLNDRGHSAGLSNLVQVPAAPTLPPPANLAAQVRAAGVVLSWTPTPRNQMVAGFHYLYRIYSREKDAKSDAVRGEIALETAPSDFVDRSVDWEKQYSYHVTVVTVIPREGQAEAQIEGQDTPEVTAFTHDVFPPSVPTGLQAVFARENQESFIDLGWNPGTESDLAGYNVYRRQADGAVGKITSGPLKVPAFRDQNVSPGKTYFYSVSAVDVRGNESARSAEASESVP